MTTSTSTAAEIEKEIENVQEEIRHLTNLKPPTPLPPVPMAPNLARGSSEMWKIYQYELAEYHALKDLQTETEFLTTLLSQNQRDEVFNELHHRLDLLMRRDKAVLPMLRQPTTKTSPCSYEDKVERAKLIAQHLKKEGYGAKGVGGAGVGVGVGIGGAVYDPLDNIEQIKRLQTKLMELEEKYLESEN